MVTKKLEIIIPKNEEISGDIKDFYGNFSETVLFNLEGKEKIIISGFQSLGHMYEFEKELIDKMLHIQGYRNKGYVNDAGNKIKLTADYIKKSHISLDNTKLKIDLIRKLK